MTSVLSKHEFLSFGRLLESGFIPGSLYTLSSWYKNSELSRRFGFFFLGNGIAQAGGGLLAYGMFVNPSLDFSYSAVLY